MTFTEVRADLEGGGGSHDALSEGRHLHRTATTSTVAVRGRCGEATDHIAVLIFPAVTSTAAAMSPGHLADPVEDGKS